MKVFRQNTTVFLEFIIQNTCISLFSSRI